MNVFHAPNVKVTKEDIKEKLDNYEELSDEDIDTIIRVLSSLKKNEK